MEVILVFFFCPFLSGLGKLKRQMGWLGQAGQWCGCASWGEDGDQRSSFCGASWCVRCVPGARCAGWLEVSWEGMRLVRQRGRREPVLRRAVGLEAKGSRPLISFLFFSSLFFFPQRDKRREGRGKGKSGKKQDWGRGDSGCRSERNLEGTRSGQNETCRALRAASSGSEETAAMPQNGWAAWQARMETQAESGHLRLTRLMAWNLPLRCAALR